MAVREKTGSHHSKSERVKIPKICGGCDFYNFRDEDDKMINVCDYGVDIVGNSLTCCKFFRPCLECSKCGVLIGQHHLETKPIMRGRKALCSECAGQEDEFEDVLYMRGEAIPWPPQFHLQGLEIPIYRG